MLRSDKQLIAILAAAMVIHYGLYLEQQQVMGPAVKDSLGLRFIPWHKKVGYSRPKRGSFARASTTQSERSKWGKCAAILTWLNHASFKDIAIFVALLVQSLINFATTNDENMDVYETSNDSTTTMGTPMFAVAVWVGSRTIIGVVETIRYDSSRDTKNKSQLQIYQERWTGEAKLVAVGNTADHETLRELTALSFNDTTICDCFMVLDWPETQHIYKLKQWLLSVAERAEATFDIRQSVAAAVPHTQVNTEYLLQPPVPTGQDRMLLRAWQQATETHDKKNTRGDAEGDAVPTTARTILVIKARAVPYIQYRMGSVDLQAPLFEVSIQPEQPNATLRSGVLAVIDSRETEAGDYTIQETDFDQIVHAGNTYQQGNTDTAWEQVTSVCTRMLIYNYDVCCMVNEETGAEAENTSAASSPETQMSGSGLPPIPDQGGRYTEVYEEPQYVAETDSAPAPSTLVDQLRRGVFSDPTTRVELDPNAVDEILDAVQQAEGRATDMEQRYEELKQQILEGQVGLSDVSYNTADTNAQLASAITEMTKALNRDRSDNIESARYKNITKAICDLKLKDLQGAEHGQLFAWEDWLKETRLLLKQKASGLVELLDPKQYNPSMDEHSQQLCAAFLTCFERGTRVWDLAHTSIQTNGERADLMIQAIEAEVGRGELFRAYQYTIQFTRKLWMKHDHPWTSGLSTTLSHSATLSYYAQDYTKNRSILVSSWYLQWPQNYRNLSHGYRERYSRAVRL